MSKTWIILILFLASSASANLMVPSVSLNDNGSYSISVTQVNNSDFKGEPSYNIEVQTSNSRVNPGDNYSMKIFISGVGDAQFGKMRVNIPHYIVKDKYVILKTLSFDISSLIFNNTIRSHKPSYLQIRPQEPEFDLNIANIYFNLRDIKAFLNFGEIITNEGEAPYTINFTISPKAPPGDHDIYLTLFYKSGDKWYTSSQVVSMHINEWYEMIWMQWFVILSIISAIFLQVISLLQDYVNSKKKS